MKLKTVSVSLFTVRTLLDGEEVAPSSEMVIMSYMDEIKPSLSCPPLSVCFDGSDYWLFDGYHRLEAMKRIGFNTCLIKVYKGTRRDALRRYICDKLKSRGAKAKNIVRYCIELLCEDSEWMGMGSKALANLFQRKEEFFDNLEDFKRYGWSDFALSRNKHGTLNFMRRRRG